jgi:hypothetical protein
MKSPIRYGDKLGRGGGVWANLRSRFALTIFFLSGSAISAPQFPSFLLKDDCIEVARPTGATQTIKLGRKVESDDIKFEDLNFDGCLDLKVLRERGATQEFYDVFLYSQVSKRYVYSKELSEIPCVSADPAHREIVGACFHESSCENWEEHYSVAPNGKLSLTERVGTYCDPDGDTYSYVDKLKDGKKVSSKVRQLKGDES